MRENSDMLISEITEELKNCISNFLWFIPQQEEKSNNNGVYCPKVGPQDYNGTFATIYFKTIFNKSKQYPEKTSNMLKRTDMTDMNDKQQ